MKTQVVVRVETETERFEFGRWVVEDEREDGEFVAIASEADQAEAASALGCDAGVIDLIHSNLDTLMDLVLADLLSIWRRQDELEKRVAVLEGVPF